MDQELVRKLKDWRAMTALKEGVDAFRILSNNAISAIAESRPQSLVELMAIKGIKQRKCDKYGQDLLAIVNDSDLPAADLSFVEPKRNINTDRAVCSVSQYLAVLNSGLRKYSARILAEVSSFDSRSGYLFFSLKDKTDGSVLSCFMWQNDYSLYKVDLEVGMEVIADGFPKIHEPSGRLSFQTKSIELVGEGALKAAYDKLKNKLAG